MLNDVNVSLARCQLPIQRVEMLQRLTECQPEELIYYVIFTEEYPVSVHQCSPNKCAMDPDRETRAAGRADGQRTSRMGVTKLKRRRTTLEEEKRERRKNNTMTLQYVCGRVRQSAIGFYSPVPGL